MRSRLQHSTNTSSQTIDNYSLLIDNCYGLQTADSYTRVDAPDNKYLFNGGSKLNEATGNYETMFRDYACPSGAKRRRDPALGRMTGVDMMAEKYASVSPYNFSFNDPVGMNDPSGADPDYLETQYAYDGGYKGHRIMYDDVYFGKDLGMPVINVGGAWQVMDPGNHIYIGSGNNWGDGLNMKSDFVFMNRSTFEKTYNVDLDNQEDKFRIGNGVGSKNYSQKDLDALSSFFGTNFSVDEKGRLSYMHDDGEFLAGYMPNTGTPMYYHTFSLRYIGNKPALISNFPGTPINTSLTKTYGEAQDDAILESAAVLLTMKELFMSQFNAQSASDDPNVIASTPPIPEIKAAKIIEELKELQRIRKAESVVQKSETIAKTAGQNSIYIKTPSGGVRYDLIGGAHGPIETPHIHWYQNNYLGGKLRNISEGSKSPTKVSDSDLRILINYLKSKGR